MANEASQKVMLYFLELLLNSEVELTTAQLAGHFGNASFSQEMRCAAGSNENGLREFLLKYPSLFTLQGNSVSLSKTTEKEDTAKEIKSNSNLYLSEDSLQLAAVKFLSHRMLKYQGQWIPIKSLAGHLSQMTSDMRRAIGPQLKLFLMHHSDVFEVAGESVRLQKESDCNSPNTKPLQQNAPHDSLLPSRHHSSITRHSEQSRLQTSFSSPHLSQTHLYQKTSEIKQDPASMVSARSSSNPLIPSTVTGMNIEGRDICTASVTMTMSEYSAVIFLKNNIEQNGSMKILDLMQFTEQNATESVKIMIGSSKSDFVNFLKKHVEIFYIFPDETVALVKNARLSVRITGNRATVSKSETPTEMEEFIQIQSSLKNASVPKTNLYKENYKKPPRKSWQDKDKDYKTQSNTQNAVKYSLTQRSYLNNSESDLSSNGSFLRKSNDFGFDKTTIPKTYASVGCQTLSTSDIIATQFYYDD